jgi:hypothetical protein
MLATIVLGATAYLAIGFALGVWVVTHDEFSESEALPELTAKGQQPGVVKIACVLLFMTMWPSALLFMIRGK